MTHFLIVAAYFVAVLAPELPPVWEGWPGGGWALGAVALSTVGSLLVGLTLHLTTLAGLHSGMGISQAARVHHRRSFLLRLLYLAVYVIQVWAFRWPEALIRDWPSWAAWAAGSETLSTGLVPVLLALCPFLLVLGGNLMMNYPVDRKLRYLANESRESWGLPARPIWSFRTYIDFHLRHDFLVVLLPLGVMLLVHDLAVLLWSCLDGVGGANVVMGGVIGGLAVLGLLAYPFVLRRLWRSAPLPAGALRERLEGFCGRIGLGCRDILVMDTAGAVANAMVAGLVARARYVVLSDALLEQLPEDEIEAVFGHEAAHVKLHHMQYYLLFALGSAGLISLVLEGFFHGRAGLEETWSAPLAAMLMGVGWFGVFGAISRRFERQADLVGALLCRPVSGGTDPLGVEGGFPVPGRPSRPIPSDGGQSPPASLPAEERQDSAPAPEHRAAVFASALTRVALLNGTPMTSRSWRHSSIASRVAFVRSVAGHPAMRWAFLRSVRIIKLTILFAAALAFVLFGLRLFEAGG